MVRHDLFRFVFQLMRTESAPKRPCLTCFKVTPMMSTREMPISVGGSGQRDTSWASQRDDRAWVSWPCPWGSSSGRPSPALSLDAQRQLHRPQLLPNLKCKTAFDVIYYCGLIVTVKVGRHLPAFLRLAIFLSERSKMWMVFLKLSLSPWL